MKKNNDNNYKRKNIAIIGSISLVFIIALFLLIPNTSKESKAKPNKDMITEQGTQLSDTSEEDVASDQKEEKDFYLMDYEDLVDNRITREDIFGVKPEDGTDDKENGMDPGSSVPKTSQSKSNKSIKSTSNTGKSNAEQIIVSDEDGVTVIDESPTTIKDESIHNEYEGEENQKPIEFFDVEPEKGPDVNGDVPAGGKQNVGTWN